MLSLSQKGSAINPFKSPMSLPLVLEVGRWGQVFPTGLPGQGPVCLTLRSRHTPHPPPTAERNEVKQLAAAPPGLQAGMWGRRGLLFWVAIFNKVLSGNGLSQRYKPDAPVGSRCQEAEATRYPP